MEILESITKCLADLVPFFWLLVAFILMLAYRQNLRRLIDALVGRVEAGAGLKAFGAELGPSAPADMSLPSAETTASEIADASASDQGHVPCGQGALGMFASHRDKRTAILVGGGYFVGAAADNAFLTMWDAQAMAQVNTILAGREGAQTQTALLSDERTAWEHLTSDQSIVAVGGPAANPLSKIALGRLLPAATFEAGALRVSPNLQPFYGHRDRIAGFAGGTKVDHVLVVSGLVPGTNAHVTVIAPIHGPGALPAVNVMLETDPGTLSDAGRDMDGFYAVVRAEFALDGSIATNSIVYSAPLPGR